MPRRSALWLMRAAWPASCPPPPQASVNRRKGTCVFIKLKNVRRKKKGEKATARAERRSRCANENQRSAGAKAPYSASLHTASQSGLSHHPASARPHSPRCLSPSQRQLLPDLLVERRGGRHRPAGLERPQVVHVVLDGLVDEPVLRLWGDKGGEASAVSGGACSAAHKRPRAATPGRTAVWMMPERCSRSLRMVC